MIDIIFEFNGEIERVVVKGNIVMFGNNSFGSKMTTIDGLRLDYSGVIREFPDLELEDEWREIAIQRFKKHIKDMISEKDVALYVVDELRKFGHIPIKLMTAGCRWRKL